MSVSAAATVAEAAAAPVFGDWGKKQKPQHHPPVLPSCLASDPHHSPLLSPGERLHVLDLDNDGIITKSCCSLTLPLPCLPALTCAHQRTPPGERLHVLDLDNDGLITEQELTDALTFLKANLDDQDLKALLEK